MAPSFGSTARVKGGDELPMSFNFPLAEEIVEAAKSGEAAGIAAKLAEMAELYPPGVIDAPFLTNHDMTRLATLLGNDGAKLRIAAAILLTLPGAPFLYYGEEVGIQNGPTGGDESKRTPMPWTAQGGFTSGSPWFGYAPGLSTTNVASQTNDSSSLLSRYRSLIHARNGSEALQKGTLELVSANGSFLAFVRRSAGETGLVVHNLSDSFASTGSMNFAATGFDTIFSDIPTAPTGASGAWNVSLPPRGTGIWRAR